MNTLDEAMVVVVVPVVDLERAKRFYHDKLGLEVNDMGGGQAIGAVVKCGAGTRVVLYAGHSVGMVSQAQWQVPDIEATVDALQRQGVVFERYDSLGTDERGIAEADGTRLAWFRDLDGNMFCISEAPDGGTAGRGDPNAGS